MFAIVVSTGLTVGLSVVLALAAVVLLAWSFRKAGLFSLPRAALLAVVTGSALALCFNWMVVDHFGSRMPIWDEWDGEAWHLYRAFLQGKLMLADLFAAHNEHRIFTTRLSHLMLFIVNGHWDPKLLMGCGACLHVLLMLLLGLVLWRAVGKVRPVAFSALMFVIAAIPFGSFNLLSGFQTQFYFLRLFSVILIIALAEASGTGIAVAAAAGVVALLSLGSGILAPMACLPVLLLSGLFAGKEGNARKVHWQAAACCLLLIGVGVPLMTSVPAHEALKAHSAGTFLSTFGFCTSWPFPVKWMGFFIWLPWLADACRTLVRRKALAAPDRLVLMLGIWVLLQCAAVAYSRSRDGIAPDSRYLDAIILGLPVNLASLTRLSLTSGWPRVLDMGWVAALFATLCVPATGKAWEECAKRARNSAFQSECVHRFLAGDKLALHDQYPDHVPYPDIGGLEMYLSDPDMLALLPPPWSPVALTLEGQPDRVRGFAISQVDPMGKPSPRMPVVTNLDASHEKVRRQWRSVTYDAPDSHWLLWEVSGYPNLRGDIELSRSKSQQIKISLPMNSGGEWRQVATRAPRWPWRIDLTQNSGDQWIALRGPWKIGGGTALFVWICLHLEGIISGCILILLFQAMWMLDKTTLLRGNKPVETGSISTP